ncbi:MAG: phosphodiesterase [Treponema sp.]|nr:phosphodiesterase [Treponema sp.]
MKFLVLSDIHGSSLSLKTVLDNFSGTVDSIIICGDFLNHGPRNPLPEGWNTKNTAELLNAYKNQIICVRGNCDSEVDQMLLEFPCLNSYTTIFTESKSNSFNGKIFVHHGHLYTKDELKKLLSKGSLVISGHTHITVIEKEDDLFFFNPGSISLPKCDDGKTCGLIEVNNNSLTLSLYTIDGKLIRKQVF